MNKTFKFTIGALLVGTATLASAQTQSQAQSFADQFRQMQSLQSFGTYTFKPAPVLKSTADNPIVSRSFGDTFAQMQAQEDTGTYTFEPAPVLSARAADSVVGESFAETFARMQAASSNSGEFKLPAGPDTPAFATTDSVIVAKPVSKPSTVEPVAGLQLRRGAASSVN